MCLNHSQFGIKMFTSGYLGWNSKRVTITFKSQTSLCKIINSKRHIIKLHLTVLFDDSTSNNFVTSLYFYQELAQCPVRVRKVAQKASASANIFHTNKRCMFSDYFWLYTIQNWTEWGLLKSSLVLIFSVFDCRNFN